MSIKPLAHLALSTFLATGLAGCGASTDSEFADEALDSAESTSAEGALMVPATDSATMQMTADQAASTAADKATTYFMPPGCVTSTAKGAVVTYVLKDCTGPHGLVHVSGTVVATFTAAIDGLHVHATSIGLKVNAAVINLDSDAVYTQNGATRQAAVTTRSTGTGARGTGFTHQGNYVAKWGSGCFALDGNWSTKAAGATWSTSVVGYSRCAGQCPAAGGVVTYTGGLSSVTVTVTLDGGGTAKWSSSRGRTGTVVVNCN